jgi:hypothetical protein
MSWCASAQSMPTKIIAPALLPPDMEPPEDVAAT